MSGLIGKKNSTLKKAKVNESKLLETGVKNLKFWHEASEGDTSIPFGSLVTPGGIAAAGLSNPSASDISNANLAFFKENVEVRSSLNGDLMIGLTFQVFNNQIKFVNGYEAVEGEVFEVKSENNVITGNNIVDAQPLTATGVLSSGDTEFVVGEAFKTNAYPDTQLGEVLVFVDGLVQFRNTANATAAPGADGNYQEIAATGGFGTVIKFNDTFGSDVNVIVVSRNLIAERPNISMMQYIENVAGQIDSMIPTLADLAGVNENVFQSSPNNVDLKAFGDKVNNVLNAQVPITTDWESFTVVAGTFLKAITTDPSFGSVETNNARWKRDGSDLLLDWTFRQSSAGGAGSGMYLLDIAQLGISFDLTRVKINTTIQNGNTTNIAGSIDSTLGSVTMSNDQYLGHGSLHAYSSTELKIKVTPAFYNDNTTRGQAWGNSATIHFGNTPMQVSIEVRIPIQGWEATQTLKEQLGL